MSLASAEVGGPRADHATRVSPNKNRTVSCPAVHVLGGPHPQHFLYKSNPIATGHPPPTSAVFSVAADLRAAVFSASEFAAAGSAFPPSPTMARISVAAVVVFLAVLAAAVSGQDLTPAPAPESGAFAVASPLALVLSSVMVSLAALLLRSN